MAQIENYRHLVQQVLKSRVYTHSDSNVDIYTIADTENDHYQLVNVGWKRDIHRVYGTVIHIDIKDDKIWVQWDGTDDSVARELINNGVPQSDIVLGFHAPYKREFTDFAVA